MRDYIILNGVRSTTINGLLVQSLPPVTKPLQRTQIEEIDGRDGDIVTPLGYSAYDKEIEIGLYGVYDIDAVISYFTSSGTVTFSNEPTKYYNYTIIDQIDFEKLIRYRTATVTLHVQPFKYSAIESVYSHSLVNAVSIPNTTMTKNGLTLTVDGGAIAISGTATAITEFYLPINKLTLAAGSWTWSATANGTGATAVSMRLINDIPSDANSFGGGYITLANNTTVTKNGAFTTNQTYNYAWFYIAAGTAINITSLVLTITEKNKNSFSITNTGNYFSRPKITLYGSGTLTLSINGNDILVVNMGSSSTNITIDAAAMEAYQGTPDSLMNRAVTGDYSNVTLNVGTNTVSVWGNCVAVEIENYSRWL